MGFRSDYGAYTRQLETTLEEILSDGELLQMSGYELVINDPGTRESLLRNPPSIWIWDILLDLGMRLRKALGEEPVFDRNGYRNAPFSVPNYHEYVEGLGNAIWTVVPTREGSPHLHGNAFHIVPYSDVFDAWDARYDRRGFMCRLLSPYEYCFTFWDQPLNGNPAMKFYVPELFNDGTFGVWLGVLPQPVSLVLEGRNARLTWGAKEPRVRRSEEMGRYTLSDEERVVEVRGFHWRHARALALVTAFEKMASNEPTDRYKSKMLAEQAQKDKERQLTTA